MKQTSPAEHVLEDHVRQLLTWQEQQGLLEDPDPDSSMLRLAVSVSIFICWSFTNRKALHKGIERNAPSSGRNGLRLRASNSKADLLF